MLARERRLELIKFARRKLSSVLIYLISFINCYNIHTHLLRTHTTLIRVKAKINFSIFAKLLSAVTGV